MEVVFGLEAFPRPPAPVVLALGTFDGVHRGHQALLRTARERARALGGRCAVLTFDPHPHTVLAPSATPFLLTTLEERLEIFAGLGVDVAVVVRFDDSIRQMSASAWVDALVARIGMAEVVCGSSNTFGHDREGDPELLRRLGAERRFRVWVADPVDVDGAPVSSSRIRSLLHTGRVLDAARLLGRWYALRGTVTRGAGRGRALGYPTANLQLPPTKLIPAAGIYAAYARLADAVHPAAVSIGTRPTFGPGPLQVEAYVLNFTGILYGMVLELFLAVWLRDEETFASVEDLVHQIAADVAAAPQALAVAADRAGLGAPDGETVRRGPNQTDTRPPTPDSRS
jgi:riboflavin kinase/FMN adenylyltransferase